MDSNALAGQIVIVTGASSGIGLATARRLRTAGATVALVARRAQRLDELVEELGSEHARAIACDVTSEAEVARAYEAIVADLGRVDGLVNNAGYGSFAPITETSLDEWQRMLDVNVTGSFLWARAVLPGMIERRDGWIINVCSDVSRRVFPGGAPYCASKHAQYALSLGLNAEARPHGVRVGAVLPGMVATEFANSTPEGHADWELRAEDVAEAVLFMATRPPHAVTDELTVHPMRQDY